MHIFHFYKFLVESPFGAQEEVLHTASKLGVRITIGLAYQSAVSGSGTFLHLFEVVLKAMVKKKLCGLNHGIFHLILYLYAFKTFLLIMLMKKPAKFLTFSFFFAQSGLENHLRAVDGVRFGTLFLS